MQAICLPRQRTGMTAKTRHLKNKMGTTPRGGGKSGGMGGGVEMGTPVCYSILIFERGV